MTRLADPADVIADAGHEVLVALAQIVERHADLRTDPDAVAGLLDELTVVLRRARGRVARAARPASAPTKAEAPTQPAVASSASPSIRGATATIGGDTMTQPPNPPQQQPGWPPPPRAVPPRKRKAWPIVLLAVAVVVALGAIGSGLLGDLDPDSTASRTTAPEATAERTLSPEEYASIEASSGIPPKPDAAAQRAYVEALRVIDPEIIGRHDEAIIVDRGRNQCRSIKDHPGDRGRQIALTQQRFSAPRHPDGFGPEVAERILGVVHQYLCPTY